MDVGQEGDYRVQTDEYGFEAGVVGLTESDDTRDRRRLEKWRIMLEQWDKFALNPTRSNATTFRNRIRKGIPKFYRGTVWMRLLGAAELKLRNPGQYQRFLGTAIHPKNARQIDFDLGRTLPTNVNFRNHGIGQAALRNVLVAWTAYTPTTGYTQGMSYFAAMLLLHMPEEDAFWCFVALMRLREVQGLFSDGFPLTHLLAQQFATALERYSSSTANVFKKIDLDPQHYAHKWFMRGFVSELSPEAVTRVWGIWFHDGDEKILLRTAIALVMLAKLPSVVSQAGSRAQEAVDEALKATASTVDPDVLLDAAYSIPLRRKDLNASRVQFITKYAHS